MASNAKDGPVDITGEDGMKIDLKSGKVVYAFPIDRLTKWCN